MRNLSLRFKVPIRIGALIILVATIVTLSLLIRFYIIFKEDLAVSSKNIGQVTARTLTGAILHDDVWAAYEIINAPFEVGKNVDALQADLVIVLDRAHRVFISNLPQLYPVTSDPFAQDRELADFRNLILDVRQPGSETLAVSGFGNLYVVTPIISDGILIGQVLMRYPDAVYTARFRSVVKQALYTTTIIVAVLIPLGWYWGQHMARPLVELSRCMQQVGSRLPEDLDCTIYPGNDEIGRLGSQFQAMVEELREKQQLEKQMLVADRLAAIGRFTAGIAHEINNPLGGLLNAVDNLRTYGSMDNLTQKTIMLLERGLRQIKQTVGTLLVEAKPDMHTLTTQDIEDTRTLVLSSLHGKLVTLDWHNRLEGGLDLPSTYVRQILINLLLNACHATPNGGLVSCEVSIDSGTLRIRTWNQGDPITDEMLDTLFEPYSGGDESGRGLGLWVTYQIVSTLRGTIEVSSDAQGTEFVVVLPFTGSRSFHAVLPSE